jgi:hypothetical protein
LQFDGAELVAEKVDISREEMDAFAVRYTHILFFPWLMMIMVMFIVMVMVMVMAFSLVLFFSALLASPLF